VDRNIKTS